MKHRSHPPSRKKAPPQLPVLTEIVHMAHDLEETTVPGALLKEGGAQPDAPAISPIAAAMAMAKLSSSEPESKLEAAAPLARTAPPPPTIDHYIPQTASGFSSSWWMNDQEPALPEKTSPSAVVPSVAPLSETQIVQRVLVGLNSEVSNMFEQRIREAVGPVLMRVTDKLLTELRQQITLSLHDMVVRAVALEMAKVDQNSRKT
jgi:hypothetical protein